MPPPQRNVEVRPQRLRGRVLVVEDHPTNQAVIARQLDLLGLRADIVGDGSAALERLRSRDFDAVVTDLHMPRMDGYELVREIRALERSGLRQGRLPIVAMSADVGAEVSERCRQAGMDDCVAKPVTLAVLEAQLSRWLGVSAGIAEVPLDTDVLRSLVGDDPLVIQQLTESFIASNDGLLAQLPGLAAGDDRAALRALVHRLKGSATTLGARPLVAALDVLHEEAIEGNADARCAAANQVANAYGRLRAYLEASLPLTSSGDCNR